MLCDLVTGKLSSRFIVIQDSIEHSGTCLWKSFVKQARSERHTVMVLCFDNNKARFKPIEGPGTEFLDFISCEQDWTGGGDNLCDLGIPTVTKDVVLCIDSLSSLILRTGLNQCYNHLHKTLSDSDVTGVKLKQMICLVHEDALLNRELALAELKHLASTFIQLSSLHGAPTASVTHRKSTGKVSKSVEQFHVNADYSITCTTIDLTKKVNSDVPNEPRTTFKLELRTNEKEARSQLVLPYIRRENDDQLRKGEGEIFYQLEESDDWDEDDPDDDLDI